MEKPISVLLVDDESDFVEPVAFWLRSRKYDVCTARNGREAIQKIKSTAPDIVFMDINMPGMNGLDALKNIRMFDKTLPVIMVTAAYCNEKYLETANELGIAGFFAKNYTFDQLVQMIHSTLKSRRQEASGEKEEEQ